MELVEFFVRVKLPLANLQQTLGPVPVHTAGAFKPNKNG